MSIEEQLLDLKTELLAAKLAKRHLQAAKQRRIELTTYIKIGVEKINREYQDILDLEKKTIGNLFDQILGRQENRLDLEKQEYLQAILEYNSAKEELEVLDYEMSLLQHKVENIDSLEKRVATLTNQVIRKIKFHDKDAAAHINNINKLRDLSILRIIEIKEAQRICDETMDLIHQINTELRKVDSIPVYNHPMHGKGRYSSYLKKGFITQSQQKAAKANVKLRQLENELGDIYHDHDKGLSITDYEHFIHYFYDHLITDWVLQRKLDTAVAGMETITTKLQRIKAMLEAEMDSEQQRESNYQKQKTDYLTTYISNKP